MAYLVSSILPVHAVMEFSFNHLPDDIVHVPGYGGRDTVFRALCSISSWRCALALV
jgi:hypothetical protein